MPTTTIKKRYPIDDLIHHLLRTDPKLHEALKLLEDFLSANDITNIVNPNAIKEPTSGSVIVVNTLTIAAGNLGQFTLPHGAGIIPTIVVLEVESGDFKWWGVHYDDTFLYLDASDPLAHGDAKLVFIS